MDVILERILNRRSQRGCSLAEPIWRTSMHDVRRLGIDGRIFGVVRIGAIDRLIQRCEVEGQARSNALIV
jgi:hypothetical protein